MRKRGIRLFFYFLVFLFHDLQTISLKHAPGKMLTFALFSAMVSILPLIPTSPYREDQEKGSANAMADSTSWRDLLKAIIKDPQERDRVAAELGKNAVTLTRWSTGESQPRQQHLRQLLRVLPTDLRGQFVALVQQEDASFHDEAFPDSPSNLDPDFLRGVWKMRAETSSVLLFWTLCKHVLQHALLQLDRQHAGMSMTVVQCMPPAQDGTIKSLREVFGRGTPPWSAELEREAMFLGAESLAGYVVSMCRPEAVGDLRTETTYLPHYKVGHEVSAAACPLLYANRVAGCLLVASTVPNYFASSDRFRLVLDYASLIVEAFTPEQFYPLERIRLRLMPSFEVQHRLLVTLQDRINGLMLRAQGDSVRPPLTYAQAEQLAWQELEEELLGAAEEQYNRELWSEHKRR